MALSECKICKSLYDNETQQGNSEICHSCRMMLEGTYERIHNYLRDHGTTMKIDIQKLAEDTSTTPAEMQILVELGWLERDIQTYSWTISDRQILAGEFARELEKMIERNKKSTTYKGFNRRYERKKK